MILPKQTKWRKAKWRKAKWRKLGKPLNEGNCPRGTLKTKGLTNKSTKFFV